MGIQAFLNNQVKNDKNRVALISVMAAVLLTATKLVVGLATGSLGILSEAAHSGLDLVAAVITFFAVRISANPADEKHTYGHGKVENLSAMFETGLLLVTCIWIIYEAIQRLFYKSVHVEASGWAFGIMLLSIFVDYNRSRALYQAARKHRSQALEADALHFSTDIWSSGVVILGLVLVRISEAFGLRALSQADAVAALVVAGIVIYVSLQLGRRTVAGLLDEIPSGLRSEVVQALGQVPGVQRVRHVRLRWSGPEAFADVTLTAQRDLPLEHAHQVATEAEKTVQQLMPQVEVTVHLEPEGGSDE
ncbi:MAG TPA: cation diffusion facilitator family transporter [Anaerolineales bacterium]|nr:cation diffusion facilitator family transporter [Anaerolineales bacterium]